MAVITIMAIHLLSFDPAQSSFAFCSYSLADLLSRLPIMALPHPPFCFSSYFSYWSQS